MSHTVAGALDTHNKNGIFKKISMGLHVTLWFIMWDATNVQFVLGKMKIYLFIQLMAYI